MSEFKPGLEGVVAFETEIAEPDRDGGALRYRGVDIEDLVGIVPFEKVWGLLVDDGPSPGCSLPRPTTPRDLTGNAPADLQAVTARLAGEWESRAADRHLRRRGPSRSRAPLGTMISVVAQSARVADGETTRVDPDLVATGATAADAIPARMARRSRSEACAGDRHVLDLHGRARPQRLDVHGPRRRVDRSGLRCRALVGGRCSLGPSARRRSGTCPAHARRRGGGRVDRRAT